MICDPSARGRYRALASLRTGGSRAGMPLFSAAWTPMRATGAGGWQMHLIGSPSRSPSVRRAALRGMELSGPRVPWRWQISWAVCRLLGGGRSLTQGCVKHQRRHPLCFSRWRRRRPFLLRRQGLSLLGTGVISVFWSRAKRCAAPVSRRLGMGGCRVSAIRSAGAISRPAGCLLFCGMGSDALVSLPTTLQLSAGPRCS